jgi:hypothetical protein
MTFANGFVAFSSDLSPVENFPAGGWKEIDNYVGRYEFLEMLLDIWESNWYWDSFENFPDIPGMVLHAKATAWFSQQSPEPWHEEAARDMAHEFLSAEFGEPGWE